MYQGLCKGDGGIAGPVVAGKEAQIDFSEAAETTSMCASDCRCYDP